VLVTFSPGVHPNSGTISFLKAEETMQKRIKTDFLIAQPSFASGVARIFDLWGEFDEYNRSETTAEADAKAIASDWLMVGQDLQDAMDEHESQLNAA
jgi:hypothetical protein